MTDPSDSVLRAWLLHRLPDEQSDDMEQRLMLDDGIATRLQDAEHDLVDDYARGHLDKSERADVERYLLCAPADWQRLQLSRALAHATARTSTPSATGANARRTTTASTCAPRPRRQASRSGRYWYGFAGGALAASILLAAVFSWRSNHDQAFAPRLSVRHSSGDVMADVTLLADTERGAAATLAVNIPANADAVRLQVEVARPQATAVYALSLSDAGKTPFVSENLALHHSGPYAFVETVVPSHMLAPGPVRITLAQKGSPQTPAQWTLTIVRSD